MADDIVVSDWSGELAGRLFSVPERWGWQFAEHPLPALPAQLRTRPVRRATVPPDTEHLIRARRLARTRVIGPLIVVALLEGAVILGLHQADEQRQFTPAEVNRIALGLIGLWVLTAALLLHRIVRFFIAARTLREFNRPYQEYREMEEERYQEAVQDWHAAADHYQRAVARAQYHQQTDPLWSPVAPVSDPPRIDVVGGDPRRHGWASLITTMGSSLVALGRRVAVLDLTGYDVAGAFAELTTATGVPVRRLDLLGTAATVNLLAGLDASAVADDLADALADPQDPGSQRHERMLVREVVERVLACLTAPVTLRRLAAAVHVLRQAPPDPALAPAEVGRLLDQVAAIGRDEWTTKQLRLIANQLTLLQHYSSDAAGPPLGPTEGVQLVVSTGDPKEEGKQLLDLLLIQLAQRATRGYGRGFADALIVAGVDHIRPAALESLSHHAGLAGVRLVYLIDHPRGDLEGLTGTGGAVLVMKMYNHRDAGVAAEFIGRGYRFVISQLSYQIGKAFADGGGDSFGAATTRGSEARPGYWREVGPATGLSESRAHTWTGTRNWTASDTVSEAMNSSRVYEFIVDPQQIMRMPETSFILVENATGQRRIVMGDCNPGICLVERVAGGKPPPAPAPPPLPEPLPRPSTEGVIYRARSIRRWRGR